MTAPSPRSTMPRDDGSREQHRREDVEVDELARGLGRQRRERHVVGERGVVDEQSQREARRLRAQRRRRARDRRDRRRSRAPRCRGRPAGAPRSASRRSRRRATRTRSQPSSASLAAYASPIPDDAPVTIAKRPMLLLRADFRDDRDGTATQARPRCAQPSPRAAGRRRPQLRSAVMTAETSAPTLAAAQRVLAERFGLAGFRPGQAEVIEALLAGRSALAVFPTGIGQEPLLPAAGAACSTASPSSSRP